MDGSGKSLFARLYQRLAGSLPNAQYSPVGDRLLRIGRLRYPIRARSLGQK